MYKLKKIDDKHMVTRLFVLCWMVYFTSYIGRLNYSSAMPALIQEHVLTTTEAGFVSMVYFFSYGLGQFLNGILGDRLHPRKMIFVGLFFAGVMNMIMGCLSSFLFMALVWGANGYLQAMVWPPIMRLFAEMMHKEERIKYCVHITSTMACGTLVSYLLSAGLLSLAGWRFVFLAAALIMCAMALGFNWKFREVERYAEVYGAASGQDGKDSCGEENKVSFGSVVLVSGLLTVLLPVAVHGVLKDGVTSWVPTYISEVFGTSPALSILVTTVLPVINLTGAYAAQLMYQNVCKQREVETASFFFLIALLALVLLWRGGHISILLTVVLLSLITSSMMAVNTLFVNLLPLHFEKIGRVSTVSGFFNSLAYLGTAISTFTIGIMVEKAGWDATILSWLGITLAAWIVCVIWRKQRFSCL